MRADITWEECRDLLAAADSKAARYKDSRALLEAAITDIRRDLGSRGYLFEKQVDFLQDVASGKPPACGWAAAVEKVNA